MTTQADTATVPEGTLDAVKAMAIDDLAKLRPDLVIVDALPVQEARESLLEEFDRLGLGKLEATALRGLVRESVADPVQVTFESTLAQIVALEGLEGPDKQRACEALGVAAEKYGVDLSMPTFAAEEEAAGDEEEEEKEAARESDEKKPPAEKAEEVDTETAVKAATDDLRAEIKDGKQLNRVIESLAVNAETEAELRRRVEPQIATRSLTGEAPIKAAVETEHDAMSRVVESRRSDFGGVEETEGSDDGGEKESGERSKADAGLGSLYGSTAQPKDD